METLRGWHWRRSNGTTNYLKKAEEVGETYSVEGEIHCCGNALHLSEKALDALKYAPGFQVNLVEGSGTIDKQSDKAGCQRRKLLARADAKQVVLEWACEEAELVLPIFEAKYPNDGRVRTCLDVLRKFHVGQATIEGLREARRQCNAAYTAAAAADAAAAANAASYAAAAAYTTADADAAAYTAAAAADAAADAAYTTADAAADNACAKKAEYREGQNARLEAKLYALLEKETGIDWRQM